MFGGVSAEHDVSIITGLQVLEKIDHQLFKPYVVYVSIEGEFRYFPGLKNRQGFSRNGGVNINWGKDEMGAYIQPQTGLLGRKHYLEAAYLAFHGGTGENGMVQGFLDTMAIPYTSPGVESMAITMNKSLTKEVLSQNNLPVVEGVSLSGTDIRKDVDVALEKVQAKLGKVSEKNGLIIKPAHSGSSIGINITKSPESLRKYLQAAALIDNEVLVEKLVQSFTEYNCAVRMINGQIETGEIERPLSQDEILSFADKYERGGGKKSGGGLNEGAGMASLQRELPAYIDRKLKNRIQELARQAFQACRAKGMVRIDFMVTQDQKNIYITEVNSIPGSMAYYLWEASGYTFTEQITALLEQAIKDHSELAGYQFVYESDIVEKFIANHE